MSDIPVAARSTRGESRAVSLLARIILPRPGEPLDVRKLYIEESTTNARRAHAADAHHTADRRRVRGVVLRRTSTRSRPATGGAGRSLESVVLRVGADRHGPRRRLPVQGHRRPDLRRGQAVSPRRRRAGRASSSRSGSSPSRTAAGSGSTSPPTAAVTLHERRLVRAGARTGHGEHRGGHPDLQPARRLRQRAAALTSDPLVDERDRRGDRARPGHQQGARPSGLRRGRRTARQPAVDPRPAQPRRFGRLQPGHVRGAEEHRLSADPVHGRRHPRSSRTRSCGRWR